MYKLPRYLLQLRFCALFPRGLQNMISYVVVQEYTFTTSAAVTAQQSTTRLVEKEKIASIPLPRVGPGDSWQKNVIGLRLTGECQTSDSFRRCSLLAIRFFVRVSGHNWDLIHVRT